MNFLAELRDSAFGILKGAFSCVTPEQAHGIPNGVLIPLPFGWIFMDVRLGTVSFRAV
jgi:hypothetical protein